MGITMLAIFSAFISLVFGYFFYWTRHEIFIPDDAREHTVWAVIALVGTAAAWASTVLARKWNAEDRAAAFYAGTLFGMATAVVGGAALLAHPYFSDLNPATTVYPAIVWLLAIWSALHLTIGVIMLLYCAARRLAGRMTANCDMDIVNVALYWHFTMVTVAITIAITAGIPYLA